MTFKRVILIVLTVGVVFSIALRLWASWSQPQFQSRLELYQTNLVLQASAWEGMDANLKTARNAFLGDEPIKAALKEYQDFRESVQKSLNRTETLLRSTTDPEAGKAALLKSQQLAAEVDVRLGLLQAIQGQVEAAQTTWSGVIQRTDPQPALEPLSKTAGTLAGLWRQPPQLMPNAESFIKKHLDGWFRYRALTQLYQLQQRQDSLAELRLEEQAIAQQSFENLAIVGGLPIIGCLLGVGILLFLLIQWLIQRKQALLSPSEMGAWTVPWDGEIVWQVLIFGFFLVGQFLLPLVLDVFQLALKFNPATLNERAKAVYILLDYVLLAAGGLGVLYLSIRPFFPLPEGWFQVRLGGNWFWWGLGGYLAALPLVIVVSLVNQTIWQGQGGSNPILPIALEGRDTVAIALFFVTAAVAAPIFEEVLFRGFLLPSLTRYFPVWGAIGLSALLFAIAHLNLSEVLPLATLGVVLGFVYTRSRNLLASMLLHSLWNSGTLLSLILLGSTGAS